MQLLNQFDTEYSIRANLETLKNLYRILRGSVDTMIRRPQNTCSSASSINQFYEKYERLFVAYRTQSI